jgi:hypothetical protein
LAHHDRDHSRKEPLYRKINTRTHHVRREGGGEFRHERHSGADWESIRGSMHPGRKHGHDYTPLHRFLLSRVGKPWAPTRSEAAARIDDESQIAWMVAEPGQPRRDCVRTGENSYFSGLYVDDEGVLRVVEPGLSAATFLPSCTCCTHTFNGERVPTPPGLKY